MNYVLELLGVTTGYITEGKCLFSSWVFQNCLQLEPVSIKLWLFFPVKSIRQYLETGFYFMIFWGGHQVVYGAIGIQYDETRDRSKQLTMQRAAPHWKWYSVHFESTINIVEIEKSFFVSLSLRTYSHLLLVIQNETLSFLPLHSLGRPRVL